MSQPARVRRLVLCAVADGVCAPWLQVRSHRPGRAIAGPAVRGRHVGRERGHVRRHAGHQQQCPEGQLLPRNPCVSARKPFARRQFSSVEVLMHLSCTNMTRDRLKQVRRAAKPVLCPWRASDSRLSQVLTQARQAGIQNILALRGDPPRGELSLLCVSCACCSH